MPNNFRLTGDYYVSKEGSDSNSGLTAELPKLTIQAALNLATTTGKTIVVGAGVYTEDLSKTVAIVYSLNLIADGEVIVRPNNYTDSFLFFQGGTNTAGSITIRGFTFLNTYRITANSGSGQTNSAVYYFESCTFNNCVFYTTNTNASFGTNAPGFVFKNSKIINCSNLNFIGNIGGPFLQLFASIIINSTFLNRLLTVVQNTYLDATSVIDLNSSITVSNFNFNNIQGKIVMFVNGAVSGANSNGVAQSFAQHRIDYPTYNVNSISADPKFNDAQNLNFTLQSDSPHIKGANDYASNIGGTEYAVYVKASDAELTTGATVSNLTLQGNNSYTITSPNTTGSIISDGKFIQWPRTKPLTRIEWVGSLDFNKSITAGTAGNQNVPDYETATSGAAANPDRLCLKMRYSTQQTKPTTSGEWDNGGYWTAGEYRLFEINQKPKIDANGIGNGSSSYVEFSGLGDIVPSWIQVDIILINNYNP